jgi:hypothetical protein
MPTPGLHGIAAGRFAAKVNLNTIREVKQPRSAGDDLRSLRWPALQGVSRQLSWWLSPADHDGKRLCRRRAGDLCLCPLADCLLAISDAVRTPLLTLR